MSTYIQGDQFQKVIFCRPYIDFMVGVQKQKSLAFCTKISSGSQNFYNSYCLWFTFGQISARSKTRRNRKYILDCFYLSTQVYLDKQFVLQDGRPYGSFFLAKRSICCFIFGVYSACRIAEIWGRRRCWLASTLIRKYFLFSWDKAGREMMTDTSGLSVFSKYILAFWITSSSFHYL